MDSTVNVSLAERSYPIWIGTNVLANQLHQTQQLLSHWKHAVVIHDEHLASVANQMVGALEQLGVRSDFIKIPSGEKSKCVEQLSMIWEQMLQCKADRKSVVVAIGGGVVGDLAGFAASTYMRGVRFVQIPTTLLSMVDSSVGGKTGINLPASKNIIGAFWQPHAVCIDTRLLNTLPEREYNSGLAEIVKYGVILDAEFFSYLESNAFGILNRDADALNKIIARSCELKASVVSADERETTGLRAILNYGHTFGHAIEATTAYGTYLHGEAISIGMTMAGHLAAKAGMWTAEDLRRQTDLLRGLKLPVVLNEPIPTIDLLSAMRSDKKTEHGELQLILPNRIGHVTVVKGVSESDVIQSIDANRA
ncbi:MAG: 3-dehydroquinate synthase [Pirellula sp.]|nr:3-dehydroquinate synthase [Pirellula sp.]